MRKLTLLILFCFILNNKTFSQENKNNHTISGFIKDAESGETMIGVTVYIKGTSIGTTSNAYGFYSITIPDQSLTLVANFIGYNQVEKEIDLKNDLKLDFELKIKSISLNEVQITAEEIEKNKIQNIQMGINKMDIKTIKSMPTFLGEVDVIKSVQMLPGVNTVGEGSSGFNVRGGDDDENLILLDEAPVYNPSHLLGFFSVFDPSAVKDVQLYKAGVPASYGGRASSVLDVRLKEGNYKKYQIQGGIGLVLSRLAVEGPILKDKISFLLAGRYSYVGLIAKAFGDYNLGFYDATAKLNYIINPKNKIFVSSYFGRDNLGFSQANFGWGNLTTTIRWNSTFTDKLFSNFTLIYSDFDYMLDFSNTTGEKFNWKSNILNYGIKWDFSWSITPKNYAKFGTQTTFYDFRPANATATALNNGVATTTNINLPNKYAIETGFYAENEQKITEKLNVSYGLRASLFFLTGPYQNYEVGGNVSPFTLEKKATETKKFNDFEVINTYFNLEPRLKINYVFNIDNSVKFSYNRGAQYIHLLSNTISSSTLDIWHPSSQYLKPRISDQISLGYFRNIYNQMFEISVETYFKWLENVIDFIPNSSLLFQKYVETQLLQGIGRTYGVELMIDKKIGRFKGFMSYTYSKSEFKIDGISNNEWYNASFNREHSFKLTSSFDLNKRWSFQGNYYFASGTWTTTPNSKYILQGHAEPLISNNIRSNYQIEGPHRLDLSVTFRSKPKENKKYRWDLVLTLYNVYANRIPYSVYFRQVRNENTDLTSGNLTDVSTEAVKVSFVPTIIPAITFNFYIN